MVICCLKQRVSFGVAFYCYRFGRIKKQLCPFLNHVKDTQLTHHRVKIERF